MLSDLHQKRSPSPTFCLVNHFMSFSPCQTILEAIRIVGEVYLLLKFRKEAHFRIIIDY
jgi:hypothetical protein